MDRNTHRAIARFRSALEAFGVHVEALVLYGSQAEGNAQEHSDIDIVIVSDYFEGMSMVQRCEAIGTAAARARITDPVEPLPYTVAEYEAMGPGTFVGQEVKPKGIEIT